MQTLYGSINDDASNENKLSIAVSSDHTIEIDGEVKRLPTVFSGTYALAYLIAGYSVTVFLGSNWFHSKDKTFGMKLTHTIAALLYNWIVNGYYSEKTFSSLPAEYRYIFKEYCNHRGWSIVRGLNFLFTLSLSYFASDMFAALYKELPWGDKKKPSWVGPVVEQSIFLAYIPYNYEGLRLLLSEDLYPFILEKLKILPLTMPENRLKAFRDQYTLDQFRKAVVGATLAFLQQASREVKSGSFKINANTASGFIVEVLKNNDIKLPGVIGNYAATTLAVTFSTILILSNVGLVRDTMPADKTNIYAMTASMTSLAAFLGLVGRASHDSAQGLVDLLRDLRKGVSIVSGVANWKILAPLTLFTLTGLGGAGLTANTSLYTNREYKGEVPKALYSLLNICTLLGCILFNAWPMVTLLCSRLLNFLRRYFKSSTPYFNYIDQLIEAINSAKTLDEKMEIILHIIKLDNDFQSFVQNSQIQAQLEQFKLKSDHLQQVLSYLSSDKNTAAAEILQDSSKIGLPYEARKTVLINWGMNALLPTLAIYFLNANFEQADLFSNSTLSELSADGVLYLTFTVSLLLQLLARWLTDAASTPSNFKGFCKAVGTTFGPALFATGVGALAKMVTGPALGDYGETARDSGLLAGISTAIVTANAI